jgi:flagella basal body P-ring formation protein FlgA
MTRNTGIQLDLNWFFILASAAAIFFGGFTSGWTADDTVKSSDVFIKVRATAVVQGEDILLGEIADIQAPVFLAEGIAALELAPAPKPGKMKPVDGKRIRDLIMGHDLVDSEMQVSVPKRVFVKRDSQEIDDNLLRKEADTYLSEILGTDTYEINQFSVRGLSVYPSGELTLVMTRKGELDNKGRFSFQLDVMVDHVKWDRLNVKGKVALKKPVVCAARDLKRGAVLTDADVRIQEIDIFQKAGDYLTSLSQTDQMTLNTNVSMGTCLDTNDLKLAPVVKRGEVIKLVAVKNRLSIVTLGICKEDGYTDQPVTVENLQSGKLVRGLVRKNATVEVVF